MSTCQVCTSQKRGAQLLAGYLELKGIIACGHVRHSESGPFRPTGLFRIRVLSK